MLLSIKRVLIFYEYNIINEAINSIKEILVNYWFFLAIVLLSKVYTEYISFGPDIVLNCQLITGLKLIRE